MWETGNKSAVRKEKVMENGDFKKKEVNSQIPLTGATSAACAAVTLR